MRAKLLLLRKRAKLTQTELGKRIGIGQVWYSLIETGNAPMSKTMGLALCYVLKCEPEDLVDSFADRILEDDNNNKK